METIEWIVWIMVCLFSTGGFFYGLYNELKQSDEALHLGPLTTAFWILFIFGLLGIGLAITARTDISKFHLLWWCPLVLFPSGLITESLKRRRVTKTRSWDGQAYVQPVWSKDKIAAYSAPEDIDWKMFKKVERLFKVKANELSAIWDNTSQEQRTALNKVFFNELEQEWPIEHKEINMPGDHTMVAEKAFRDTYLAGCMIGKGWITVEEAANFFLCQTEVIARSLRSNLRQSKSRATAFASALAGIGATGTKFALDDQPSIGTSTLGQLAYIAHSDPDAQVRTEAQEKVKQQFSGGEKGFEETTQKMVSILRNHKDEKQVSTAAIVLNGMGEMAIPYLNPLLEDQDPEVRRIAARILAMIKEDQEEILRRNSM